MVATEVKLSFDHGLIGPIDGAERRRIRYHIVRLLDRPDELTGVEVGVLEADDEVQLLEKSGTYWFVLCPDGRQGWVHKMVLGEVVGDVPGPAARATAARDTIDASIGDRFDVGIGPGWPTATDSSAREVAVSEVPGPSKGPTATDAGVDIDDDVMQAFLDSRAQH